MSNIIGTGTGQGTLKCFIHEYETLDINEWNDHCINEGHTDSGTTQCVDCNCGITFTDIPYQKITPAGKQIQLRCPDCFTSYTSQRLKISRQDVPNEEEDIDNKPYINQQRPQQEAPQAEQQIKQNPKPSLKGARVI